MVKFIIIIVIAAVIFLASCTFTTEPISPKPAVKITSSAYCNEMNTRTAEIKARITPDEYFATHENKEHYMLWKELFLQENQVSDEFFNDHIRIERTPSGYGFPVGSSFSVISYYIADWAHISIHDRFTLDRSEEEIRSRFQQANPPTSDGLNYITEIKDNSGNVIDNIIPCEQVIQILQSKNALLLPQHIYFITEDLILQAGGIDPASDCSDPVGAAARLSLVTGEILSYTTDVECPVNGG